MTATMIDARRLRIGAGLLITAALLGGCTLFGGNSKSTTSASVFSVKAGQCFQAPSKVQAELSSLQRTACTSPHTREAYAVVPYAAAESASGGATGGTTGYPGSDALSSFAKGACAQRYRGYVGVDYLDSSLFFTYLFPSVRSWEQDDDRKIICFVTTTGRKLTASVKGSKL